MSNGENREGREGLPSMDELKLNPLVIKPDSLGGDEEQTETSVDYQGFKIDMTAAKMTGRFDELTYVGDGQDPSPASAMAIEARKGKDRVGNLALSVKQTSSGEVEGSSNVWSNKESGLKGFGLELWKQSFKFMQAYADASGGPVTHRVIKSPDLGLSSEKWDEIFKPILEKEGYEFVGQEVINKAFTDKKGDVYKKIYQAQK